MTKPLIYISGPITNNPNHEKQFKDCEDFLIQEDKYFPVNPASGAYKVLEKLNITEPKWIDYMRASLILLLQDGCKNIIMLTGWHKSEGSTIELMNARYLEYKTHLYFHTEKNNKRRLMLR